jgi:RNA polymerase sigma-70 factor (ECF subfamily)
MEVASMAHPERDSAGAPNRFEQTPAGNDPARRNELIERACGRLRRLTRKMLRDFRRLKRWEETDDVFQDAMVRLCFALQEATVPSLRDLYRLAAWHIRRRLLDLVRHYFGPEGAGVHEVIAVGGDDSNGRGLPGCALADSTYDPARLALWTEFHQLVEALPDEEREAFDLLWYQSLSPTEAATLTGVSVPTMERRWLAARRRLRQALKGEAPIP